MPGRTKSRYGPIDDIDMLDTFSPTLLKEILRPLRTTLTSLRLDTDSMVWPSHDQSELDLSDFISLQNVTLSSRLLFEQGLVAWLRTGVWRLLPVSIEKLAVCLQSLLRHAFLTNSHRLCLVMQMVWYVALVVCGKGFSTGHGTAARALSAAVGCTN